MISSVCFINKSIFDRWSIHHSRGMFTIWHFPFRMIFYWLVWIKHHIFAFIESKRSTNRMNFSKNIWLTLSLNDSQVILGIHWFCSLISIIPARKHHRLYLGVVSYRIVTIVKTMILIPLWVWRVVRMSKCSMWRLHPNRVYRRRCCRWIRSRMVVWRMKITVG